MKKYISALTLLFITIFASNQTKAQDGFFSEARTLEQGVSSLGIQPVFLTEQEDFMLMFRGAYGFQSGLTGHAKLGIFEDEVYIGTHIEGNIASEPNSGISVAALGGIYSYGDLGLKAGLNISKLIEPIAVFTGINYQPLFLNGTTLHSVLIPVGIDLHLKKSERIDLVFEADIPVNDDAEFLQVVTFGARFYLD